MRDLINAINRIYHNGMHLFALAFLLFFLCAPTRLFSLFFILVPVAILAYVNRHKLDVCRHWILTHCDLLFWIVLIIGLGLRIGIALCVGDLSKFYSGGDQTAMLQKIAALVQGGEWIQNKSWTSVVCYSCFAKLFSLDFRVFNCVNIGLFVIVSLLAYRILKEMIGPVAGVFLTACYSFNLQLAYATLFVSCEQFYLLFIVLTIWAFGLVIRSQNCRTTLVAVCGMSFFAWLAIWARSDGLVFLLAVLLALTMRTVLQLDGRKRIVCVLAWLSAILLAVLSYHINMRIDGSRTIFCSNDNYIPRLVGLEFKHKGECNSDGMNRVMERFLREHPEKIDIVRNNKFSQPVSYINEILPYIKDEIRECRKRLTVTQWVELIWHKERVIFWNSTGGRTFSNWWVSMGYEVARNFLSVICGIVLLAAYLFRRKWIDSVFVESFWIYTSGAMYVYAVSEVSTRYSFLFYFLLSFVAAIVVEKGVSFGSSEMPERQRR